MTTTHSIQAVLNHKTKTGQPTWPAIKGIITFFVYWLMVALWYRSAQQIVVCSLKDSPVYCPARYWLSEALWSLHPHVLQMAVGIGFGEMSVCEGGTTKNYSISLIVFCVRTVTPYIGSLVQDGVWPFSGSQLLRPPPR